LRWFVPMPDGHIVIRYVLHLHTTKLIPPGARHLSANTTLHHPSPLLAGG